MLKIMFGLFLGLLSLDSHAGWYEVTNFAGTIGSQPVHVSLQTFLWLGEYSKEARVRVVGSYYYDAHRIPIRLHGTRQDNGDMKLCESSELSRAPLAPDLSRNDPCPIALTFRNDEATGTWQNAKRSLPISLKVVGRFDDTSGDKLEGVVEIPMWYHENGKMLLGVYEASQDCGVHLARLKVVDSADGKAQEAKGFPGDDCLTGLLMTDIYQNVEKGGWRDPRRLIVHIGGGKMGSDEEYLLRTQ